jgi:glutamine amidotransferase-like uncharacterized protein
MKKLLVIFCFIISMFYTSISFSHEKNTIYIYHDEGVSEESLNQTILAFKNLQKKYNVTTINSEQVKAGIWTENAILFIIPGGADLPYVKKLNGKGNDIIKKYVMGGGSFLGICAGAFYGSSYVEFDKNGPLEVLGNRELGFFKGKSIGPILAPYDYKTQSSSRAATIYTTLSNIPEAVVFYNGGGFFEHANQYQNTEIIANYENNLPAIILINYGAGKVLLSAVHFEYDPNLLDNNDPYIQKIITPLHQNNDSRKILFEQLMKYLIVN